MDSAEINRITKEHLIHEEFVVNVLMLAPEFTPIQGGAATYVMEISRHLPGSTNVHILASRLEPSNGSQNEDADVSIPGNVTVHQVWVPRRALPRNVYFQVICRRHMRRLIREQGIDVVHSQSEMPDLLLSPKKIRPPILTTVHSTIEGHFKILKSNVEDRKDLTASERFVLEFGPILKTIENRYYTTDRHYLTVSNWGKSELMLEKGLQSESIQVVHNGVDAQQFNPSRRDNASREYEHLHAIEEPKVLFLSRLAMRKGISHFLKAIPKVLERVDAHFIVAGPGRLPSFSEHSKNLTFLGHVPHARTPEIYALADVFTLPSLSENLPISLLEAMASETAVIATRIGGIPEIIDQRRNGIMIRPNSVDSLADAIVWLVESDEFRESIAKEGRKTARDRFSWGKAAAETNECYEALLALRQS